MLDIGEKFLMFTRLVQLTEDRLTIHREKLENLPSVNESLGVLWFARPGRKSCIEYISIRGEDEPY